MPCSAMWLRCTPMKRAIAAVLGFQAIEAIEANAGVLPVSDVLLL